MKNIEVVAAVIVRNSEVFAAQRAEKGEVALKWEFPGGKIEPGETHHDALVRELHEELGIEATVGEFITTVRHQYQTFHLTMHAYFVTIQSEEVRLTEHIASAWLKIDDLLTPDWAPADIPIAQLVCQRMTGRDTPA